MQKRKLHRTLLTKAERERLLTELEKGKRLEAERAALVIPVEEVLGKKTPDGKTPDKKD